MTIFGNPGSTEIPLLSGLPEDLRFVLALHEGSAVGIATATPSHAGRRRWSTCTPRPGSATPSTRSPTRAICELRSSSSSGSRTGAILPPHRSSPATASNDSPATIRSGRPSRRGRRTSPERSRAPGMRRAPGAGRRSSSCRWATGRLRRRSTARRARPLRLLSRPRADECAVDELAALIADAQSPALVVGAGIDSVEGWAAIVALAERLAAPSGRSPSAARPASRRTTRSSPGTCTGAGAGGARRSPAATWSSSSAARRSGTTSSTKARRSSRGPRSP